MLQFIFVITLSILLFVYGTYLFIRSSVELTGWGYRARVWRRKEFLHFACVFVVVVIVASTIFGFYYCLFKYSFGCAHFIVHSSLSGSHGEWTQQDDRGNHRRAVLNNRGTGGNSRVLRTPVPRDLPPEDSVHADYHHQDDIVVVDAVVTDNVIPLELPPIGLRVYYTSQYDYTPLIVLSYIFQLFLYILERYINFLVSIECDTLAPRDGLEFLRAANHRVVTYFSSFTYLKFNCPRFSFYLENYDPDYPALLGYTLYQDVFVDDKWLKFATKYYCHSPNKALQQSVYLYLLRKDCPDKQAVDISHYVHNQAEINAYRRKMLYATTVDSLPKK